MARRSKVRLHQNSLLCRGHTISGEL